MTSVQHWPVALFFVASAVIAQVRAPGKADTNPTSAETKPEDLCVLGGRITDALTGEPVKNANIQLRRRSPNPNSPVYRSASERDGTYEFPNIEPGSYNLAVSVSGYSDTAYRATRAVPTGTVINLRPGMKLANIDVTLKPLGIITGTVLDQDGSPVAGVSVAAVASGWLRGRLVHYLNNGTITDDLGRYRMARVRPGRYYLVARTVRATTIAAAALEPADSDVRPVRTYYPSELTLDTASPLTVRTGQQLTAMNIRLRTSPTHHIRGTVAGLSPDTATENLRVRLMPRGEETAMFNANMAPVAKDQRFEFAGAAPGDYTLCLAESNAPFKAVARANVTLGQADLDNAQLVVTPVSLQGQITIENAPAPGVAPLELKRVLLTLHGAEPLVGGGLISATVNEDGTFAFENLAPGKYDVLVGGIASSAYPSSIQFAGREMIEQELDLTGGGGRMTIAIRYGPAEVRGSVPELQHKRKGQSPSQQDVTVVLIADSAPEDLYGIRMIPPDNNGSFTTTNVLPRQYFACAIEQLDPSQLQNPDVLKQLGSNCAELAVRENDKKQIDVPLITAEQMAQIYTRLGIEIPQ